MSDTPPSRRMVRSIGAVFAGVLTIVVLSAATDMAMHGNGVFPPAGQRCRTRFSYLPRPIASGGGRASVRAVTED